MLYPLTLASQLVRLEPLVAGDADALAAAAGEDRSTYGYTWVPDGLAEARRYVQAALEQQDTGRAVVHVVRTVTDGRIVGTTRFRDLEVFGGPPGAAAQEPAPSDDRPPSVAEIGSTWYAASAQRTGVNTHAKLLQLTHAFEVWRTLRVTLKTDSRNTASRRAIEQLGARAEGVRRAHRTATDGTVRDSAYYSIIASEWPDVRDRLRQRIAVRPSGVISPSPPLPG